MNVFDHIIKEPEDYLDWLLGGDSSEQKTDEFIFLVYAIVAFKTEDITKLEKQIAGLMKSTLGFETVPELHAKTYGTVIQESNHRSRF